MTPPGSLADEVVMSKERVMRNEANSEGDASLKCQVSSRKSQESGLHARPWAVRVKRSQFGDRETGLPPTWAALGSFVKLSGACRQRGLSGHHSHPTPIMRNEPNSRIGDATPDAGAGIGFVSAKGGPGTCLTRRSIGG